MSQTSFQQLTPPINVCNKYRNSSSRFSKILSVCAVGDSPNTHWSSGGGSVNSQSTLLILELRSPWGASDLQVLEPHWSYPGVILGCVQLSPHWLLSGGNPGIWARRDPRKT